MKQNKWAKFRVEIQPSQDGRPTGTRQQTPGKKKDASHKKCYGKTDELLETIKDWKSKYGRLEDQNGKF